MTEKLQNVLECYESIGKWLSDEVPERWDRIDVEFQIISVDDVWDYTITYVPHGSPAVEKQFFIDDTGFHDCFFQLARMTSKPDKGFFKRCKFSLHSDGRYKSDFEY